MNFGGNRYFSRIGQITIVGGAVQQLAQGRNSKGNTRWPTDFRRCSARCSSLRREQFCL